MEIHSTRERRRSLMEVLTQPELEQVIVIMRDMQRVALEGDWHELIRLDNERRAVLNYDSEVDATPAKYFSATKTLAEHDSLKKEILQLDNLILKTVEKARGELISERHERSAQIKAKEGYAQACRIR